MVRVDLAVQIETDPIISNRKGEPEPDPDLREQENVAVPAGAVTWYEAVATGRLASSEYVTTVEDHLAAEVHPYVPDAWIDHTKTKVGYEILRRATSTSTSHPGLLPRSVLRQ